MTTLTPERLAEMAKNAEAASEAYGNPTITDLCEQIVALVAETERLRGLVPEVTETVQWGIAWAEEPDKIQAIPTTAGKEYVDRKASREHGDVIYTRVWRTYPDQIGDWEVTNE